MGAIQPNDDFAPYGIEMRGESFYLYSWHPDTQPSPTLEAPNAISIPAGDAQLFLTALLRAWELVRAHSDTVELSPAGLWTVDRNEDLVRIAGPFIRPHVNQIPAEPGRSGHRQLYTEIEYRHLRGLIEHFRAANPARVRRTARSSD